MEVALDPNLKEGVLGNHATLWDKNDAIYFKMIWSD